MIEKTKVCDSCGEEWEEAFFCEKCSGLYSEEREIPNFEYLGYPDPETTFEMVDEHLDICLNCCMGHTKPNNASTGHAHALVDVTIPDEDCPF